ncbi:ORF6C domain-containing protein [Clostridium botulinum]|nr:ORF6C domain-containing protein [Clostridium botulinum]EKO2043644.1 ORF6C domain-containing protein [Clostridium botulinum]
MKKVNLSIENGQPVATEIKPVEVNGKRVLTTEQLGEVYEVEEVRIRQGFSRNQDKFQEGKHYFKLQGEELKQFKREYLKDTSLKLNSLMLWTERGANRHCKILDTDKAWEQFDNLEETYFRVKENKLPPMSIEDIIITQLKEQKKIKREQQQLKEEQNIVKTRLTGLEGKMTIDYAQQEELGRLAREKIVRVLGGKGTPAYKKLNKKVFSEFWRDYKRIMRVNSYKNTPVKNMDKAILIIDSWKPSVETYYMILGANSQVSF